MKNLFLKKGLAIGISIILFIAMFAGCKMSENNLGKWFALNKDGEEVLIEISEDAIAFTKGDESESYKFKVSQKGFHNGLSYSLMDVEGENPSVTLVIPDSKNPNFAQIVIPSDTEDPYEGEIIYIMSRDNYPESDKFL